MLQHLGLEGKEVGKEEERKKYENGLESFLKDLDVIFQHVVKLIST